MTDQLTPPTAPPILSYADVPARWGITYGETADGLFISIQIPIWRRMLAAALGVPLFVFIMTNWLFAVLAFVIVLIVGLVRKTFQNPVTIEITGNQLIIRNLEASKKDYIAPRVDVYDVHFVPHSGKIVIHTQHQQMLEFRPVKDPQLLQWIAQTIQQNVFQPPYSALSPVIDVTGDTMSP